MTAASHGHLAPPSRARSDSLERRRDCEVDDLISECDREREAEERAWPEKRRAAREQLLHPIGEGEEYRCSTRRDYGDDARKDRHGYGGGGRRSSTRRDYDDFASKDRHGYGGSGAHRSGHRSSGR